MDEACSDCVRAASRAQLSLDAALREAFVCAPPTPPAPLRSPESEPSTVVAASACLAGAAGRGVAGVPVPALEWLLLELEVVPVKRLSAASDSACAASTAERADGAIESSGRM